MKHQQLFQRRFQLWWNSIQLILNGKNVLILILDTGCKSIQSFTSFHPRMPLRDIPIYFSVATVTFILQPIKRKIKSSLTIDEKAARLNGFQYGSRVVPQVTWFYADSLLSCRSKSYETVLLHYGNGFSIKFFFESIRSATGWNTKSDVGPLYHIAYVIC